MIYMGFSNRYLFSIFLSLTSTFLLIFLTTLWINSSYALSNLTLISKYSNPFGKSYSAWTQEWWKWFIGIPYDSNHPFLDKVGTNCNRNQSGPVWFLSGSEKIPVEKTCVIPKGKAILVPILNFECSYFEDKTLKTIQDLINCATNGANNQEKLEFKYNEKVIPQDQIKKEFRIATPPIIINFPTKNLFTTESGPSTIAGDGHWAMFEAPPPGNYDIKFKGCGFCDPPLNPNFYQQDVTYHLKVLP
jgi:hypothetical protein